MAPSATATSTVQDVPEAVLKVKSAAPMEQQEEETQLDSLSMGPNMLSGANLSSLTPLRGYVLLSALLNWCH